MNLPSEPRGNGWDTAIEFLLAALLAFMPLALGVVARWSEEVVLATVTVACLLLLLRLIFRNDFGFVWSESYLFVVLFVALAFAQLLPLPANVVRAVSPNTVGTKATLLGDVPGAGQALGRLTLSFCPGATRHDLAIVLVDAAVFIVTVNVFRRPDQIKRLLLTVTAVGAAVILLALAQDLLGAGDIYWLIPMPGGGVPRGGPFVNHNNFAQFANLCAGAALALLLVHLGEISRHRGPRRWRAAGTLQGPELRPVWLLCALLVAAFVAIATSLSRGGIIATLVALAVTATVLAIVKTSGGRGPAVALLGLAAFGCVVYFGFDAVYERFASEDVNTYGGRRQIFAGVARLFRTYPVVGTGLGTHQFVYPMVDTSTGGSLATHAENEYAQVAEEMGVAGVLTVAGFVATILFYYVRSVRRPGSPIRAAAFGLGFGLVAMMVHSLSDFGQHFPAIGCLSAVSCGLLVSLARLGREGERAGSGEPAPMPARFFAPLRLLGWAAVAAIVAGLAWRLPAADAARRGEAHWDVATALESGLGEKQWDGTEDEYARLITEASAAADLCPDNVRYRYGLNAYRWRSVGRFYAPETPLYVDYAARIVDELQRARLLCPTYGPPYSLMGQLEVFVLDRPEGAEHIRTGYRLAPIDAACCFAAGKLNAFQHRWDASLEAFSRAVRLDGRLRPDVLDVYLGQVGRPDLAVVVVGDDWASLTQLADRLEKPTDPNERAAPEVAAAARRRAASILVQASQKPDASADVLDAAGNLAFLRKDYTHAIDCYRRALSKNYNQVDWHLQLARSLAAAGQPQPARHEARIVLHLRPESEDGRKLLEKLPKPPGADEDLD